ncbi:MAG: hypothetical protein IV090_19660 [Candidatus Sericytochromatia bacterium]|nr:hypothetical protein [Candidatus Sericytochromatia bacterium]
MKNMLEDPEFKRYVLNEFFWELAQHPPLPPEFVDVDRESIVVLHFKPNRDLCLRLGNCIYDIRLSWRGAVPAEIHKREPVQD